MKKWEYMELYISDEAPITTGTTAEHLNVIGEQGWEFTGHVSDTGYGQNYLMKREVK